MLGERCAVCCSTAFYLECYEGESVENGMQGIEIKYT